MAELPATHDELACGMRGEHNPAGRTAGTVESAHGRVGFFQASAAGADLLTSIVTAEYTGPAVRLAANLHPLTT